MSLSIPAIPALLKNALCGKPTAEQRVAAALRDSHKASHLDRDDVFKNAYDDIIMQDRVATTFGQVFVAPSRVEYASHIVAHNFDAARLHKGIQTGKAAGLHQTLYDPGRSPRHTMVMKFSSFPTRDECHRIIAGHVKAGVADKTVPPEFAATLRRSMTRDLSTLRSAAGKAGGKVDGFECVLRYELVPGAASGGTSRNNVALSEWCALTQGESTRPALQHDRPAIQIHGPTLALGLDAFKAMPELKHAFEHRHLTPALALQCLSDHRHDERVARLTSTGEPMTAFVNAYIESSKTNDQRQQAQQRAIRNQRPAKPSWPLPATRDPNFIDAHHFHPACRIAGGSSTDHLMSIAKQWKPSVNRATNAYRFAWIMNDYASQMNDTASARDDLAESGSVQSDDSWERPGSSEPAAPNQPPTQPTTQRPTQPPPARFANRSAAPIYHHYETIDEEEDENDREVGRLMAPSEPAPIVVKAQRAFVPRMAEPVPEPFYVNNIISTRF